MTAAFYLTAFYCQSRPSVPASVNLEADIQFSYLALCILISERNFLSLFCVSAMMSVKGIINSIRDSADGMDGWGGAKLNLCKLLNIKI
jgi:hypothetical protein